MTKKILFVTGTRADFGKLEPLAEGARDKGFEVSFLVTGMHMLKKYGLTKLEVSRMPGIATIEMLNQKVGDPQDKILANTIERFSDQVSEIDPDLIVVHGDRAEALACSIVAATNYILSAHVEGGEVSGTIDEAFRHCVTKLSAHHFVSSTDAGNRILSLGENAANVHIIGSPELDFHANDSGVSLAEVKERYEICFDDFGICMFHPVTSEQDSIGQQARDLFSALKGTQKPFVVIAPNNDPGSEAIFETLDSLPSAQFRVLPSMRFSNFSELLKNSACLVGNSSAGVREAPFMGIPSIDVGTRQNKRNQSPSIKHLSADQVTIIRETVLNEWGHRYPVDTKFGEGKAREKFLDVIMGDEFWNSNLQKVFQDR